MKRLLFLAVAALVGCATAGNPGDVRARILQLDAEWSEAAQSRDVDRIVSYWADDATILPPGGPPVVGKAAIREFVAKSFENPSFRISWKTNDVVVSEGGDFAYGIGTNRVNVNGPDGTPVTVDGKAVTIWRREKDGSWKCVVDIWNDAPPARR
jgi:uncharacterized protein (TIGR02246 family)